MLVRMDWPSNWNLPVQEVRCKIPAPRRGIKQVNHGGCMTAAKLLDTSRRQVIPGFANIVRGPSTEEISGATNATLFGRSLVTHTFSLRCDDGAEAKARVLIRGVTGSTMPSRFKIIADIQHPLPSERQAILIYDTHHRIGCLFLDRREEQELLFSELPEGLDHGPNTMYGLLGVEVGPISWNWNKNSLVKKGGRVVGAIFVFNILVLLPNCPRDLVVLVKQNYRQIL